MITPGDYIKARSRYNRVIRYAEEELKKILVEAQKCPPPPTENLRPVTKEDLFTAVKPGSIVWYLHTREWIVVDSVNYTPGYSAPRLRSHTGLEYGIQNAYIEKEVIE